MFGLGICVASVLNHGRKGNQGKPYFCLFWLYLMIFAFEISPESSITFCIIFLFSLCGSSSWLLIRPSQISTENTQLCHQLVIYQINIVLTAELFIV